MIWFVAIAIMTVTVFTVGTLAAADILTKRGRDWQKAVRAAAPATSPGCKLPNGRHESQIEGSPECSPCATALPRSTKRNVSVRTSGSGSNEFRSVSEQLG